MSSQESFRADALRYHAQPRPGKIEVEPTKPCATQRDLSLAYTPGVAEPVRAIHADPPTAYDYTSRANLVGVITNGTAVLGLGDVGPLAAKPVMEGKGVLFKRFAHIDVFDLEVDAEDPDTFIDTVARLEPTFGGINLEDIGAPHCFRIEEALKARMDIPVFHDDQHGTAIIIAAGLINALELQGKDIGSARIVCIGAGSAGIATLRLLVALGARRENLRLTDRLGVVHAGRKDEVDPYKAEFAAETDARSLEDALEGADVVIGVSVGGMLQDHHIASLAPHPIVFALANPDPEILPEDAHAVRDDLIIATGRSDYPNQVNNVLGFPFIFRGALDVRAREINTEMQLAAARALAALAREPVPDEVAQAYDVDRLAFGPDYFIPKPLDPRLIQWVPPAVAQAAAETGAATVAAPEAREYAAQLEGLLDRSMLLMRKVMRRAHRAPKRVVYPEGENRTILRAAEAVRDEGLAEPLLVGRERVIRERLAEEGVSPDGLKIVDPAQFPAIEDYIADLHTLRGRKGLSLRDARRAMRIDPFRFAAMMVRRGDADALVGGVENHYATLLRPSLQIIPHRRVFGMHMLFVGERIYFLGDTTVNIDPSAEDLTRLAVEANGLVRHLGMEPRIAMLSFSNFGASRSPRAQKVRDAVALLHEAHPEMEVEGEMQADAAVEPHLLQELFPFAGLSAGANVLLFPDLDAGNAAYKLLMHLGRAQAVGPILVGMEKPVQIVEWGASATDVVNMSAFAVQEVQQAEKNG
ncbi:malic enzyme [Thiohalorhabdus denitrificans]|uniref:NADP-dependent malic enzyme n=1 Tax=Thiohalorhabdus denitrificans TaxID=381306 RepID=A0A0P9CPJ9_9GAMM|nr:NADP-dependent malic enzyme [Thiohalorhabdus denitrificans]KPV41002.1 malic enzyme [Thiohalorhabdus denitrificans]SCY42108.1 allosteric NADP-dependent malic enzyme [Thiohalorhabdus denitrificans]